MQNAVQGRRTAVRMPSDLCRWNTRVLPGCWHDAPTCAPCVCAAVLPVHPVLHNRVLAVQVGTDASQLLNLIDANLAAAVTTDSTGSSSCSSTSTVRAAAAPSAYACPLGNNYYMGVVELLGKLQRAARACLGWHHSPLLLEPASCPGIQASPNMKRHSDAWCNLQRIKLALLAWKTRQQCR
jgi:hypothetical protein